MARCTVDVGFHVACQKLTLKSMFHARMVLKMQAFHSMLLVLLMCDWRTLNAEGPETLLCPAQCSCQFPDDDNNNIIDCSHRKLNNLPDMTSLASISLYRLLLRQNSIRSLPADSFQGLRINGIDLDFNDLQDISMDTFNGLEESLQYLSLRGNKQIGMNVTQSLQRLKKLRTLNLVDIGLVKLSSNFIGNLPNMEVLLLSENELNVIDPDAFVGLESLKKLNLDESAQINLPTALQSLHNLVDLSLKVNDIQELNTEVLSSLSKLEILDLSYNRFISGALVDGTFQPIEDTLRELHLPFCDLVSLSDGVLGDLAKLQKLVLAGNRDFSLQQTNFQLLSQLRYLDLSFIAIEGSEPFLLGMENLEELILEFCHLTSIPSAQLRLLSALKRVDLNGNKVTDVTYEDTKAISATTWELFNNGLNSIANNVFIDHIGKPMILDLRLNKISDVGFLFDSCVAGRVNLNRNPVKCDCDLYSVSQRKDLIIEGTCASDQSLPSLTNTTIGGDQFVTVMRSHCQDKTAVTERCSDSPGTSGGEASKHKQKVATHRAVTGIITMFLLLIGAH